MRVRRRISATYKDIPGGQILGHTFDYTHRLLDASLLTRAAEGLQASKAETARPSRRSCLPRPARHRDEQPRARLRCARRQRGRTALIPGKPVARSPRSYAKVMDFLEKEGLLPAPAKEGTNGAAAAPADITRSALTLPAGQ